jgi:hypothetical protein
LIFTSGKHSAGPFSSLQQFLMLMPRINEAKKTLATGDIDNKCTSDEGFQLLVVRKYNQHLLLMSLSL